MGITLHQLRILTAFIIYSIYKQVFIEIYRVYLEYLYYFLLYSDFKVINKFFDIPKTSFFNNYLKFLRVNSVQLKISENTQFLNSKLYL